MSKAIGMIEFKTTATGITAADAMVKTSEVEIVEAQTVCPGKYIAIITGDLSAVKAAVDAAVTTYEDKCIDSFVLGNPHESIFPAICFFSRIEPHHKLIATAYQPGAKTLISNHSSFFLLCRLSLPLPSQNPAATSAHPEKAFFPPAWVPPWVPSFSSLPPSWVCSLQRTSQHTAWEQLLLILMVFLGIRVTEIIFCPLIAHIIRHIAAICLLSGTRAGSACF